MFRTWMDYRSKDICPKCKQNIKPVYQGLINMGSFIHDRDECPMRDFGYIQSCAHCGKDLTGL
jgi:hypothetical protein